MFELRTTKIVEEELIGNPADGYDNEDRQFKRIQTWSCGWIQLETRPDLSDYDEEEGLSIYDCFEEVESSNICMHDVRADTLSLWLTAVFEIELGYQLNLNDEEEKFRLQEALHDCLSVFLRIPMAEISDKAETEELPGDAEVAELTFDEWDSLQLTLAESAPDKKC